MSVDTSNRAQMIDVIKSSLGTKFVSRWSDLMCGLAYSAVKTVMIDDNGHKEIDIKRYVRIEKVYTYSELGGCVAFIGSSLISFSFFSFLFSFFFFFFSFFLNEVAGR